MLTTHFMIYIYHYLVVRGKSFLVETETEEDDASNEGVFQRALKPGAQNKAHIPKVDKQRCIDNFSDCMK